MGDASAISAPDAAYDAVFDFGIIHHVPDWRRAVAEVQRVLRPGGTFYCEEMLKRFILNPVVRRVLEHPLDDRFDAKAFQMELERAGFELLGAKEPLGSMVWCTARKHAAAAR